MKDMKFFVIDAANRTAAEMKTSMLTDIEKLVANVANRTAAEVKLSMVTDIDNLVKKASDDLSTNATFETDFNNLKMELDEKNTRMEKRMKMLLNEMATAHDESQKFLEAGILHLRETHDAYRAIEEERDERFELLSDAVKGIGEHLEEIEERVDDHDEPIIHVQKAMRVAYEETANHFKGSNKRSGNGRGKGNG